MRIRIVRSCLIALAAYFLILVFSIILDLSVGVRAHQMLRTRTPRTSAVTSEDKSRAATSGNSEDALPQALEESD